MSQWRRGADDKRLDNGTTDSRAAFDDSTNLLVLDQLRDMLEAVLDHVLLRRGRRLAARGLYIRQGEKRREGDQLTCRATPHEGLPACNNKREHQSACVYTLAAASCFSRSFFSTLDSGRYLASSLKSSVACCFDDSSASDHRQGGGRATRGGKHAGRADATLLRCHTYDLSRARTWFLSRALENWLIDGGTFRRWYRICCGRVATHTCA